MRKIQTSELKTSRRVRRFFGAFALMFASVLGSAFIAESFSQCHDKISAAIVQNNRVSKFGETYWTISIKENNPDLAWKQNSYAYTLQSFAGSWSDVTEIPVNIGFTYNQHTNQVLIDNGKDKPIGVKVIGDAYRNTLARFGFKLRNDSEFNSLHNFYCSAKVSEYLGDSLDCNLRVVDSPYGSTQSIHFKDVIESTESKLFNDLIGDDPYIVVPHFATTESAGYTSFDNLKITGHNKFVMILRSDKYQNEFSLNRINYFVYRQNFSKQYVSSFVDNPEDLNLDISEIRSGIQDLYASYKYNMNATIFRPLYLAAGLVTTIASFIILLLFFIIRWSFKDTRLIHYLLCSFFIGIGLYWLIGQTLFALGITFAFWSPMNRILTTSISGGIALFYVIAIGITYLIVASYRKHRAKKLAKREARNEAEQARLLKRAEYVISRTDELGRKMEYEALVKEIPSKEEKVVTTSKENYYKDLSKELPILKSHEKDEEYYERMKNELPLFKKTREEKK